MEYIASAAVAALVSFLVAIANRKFEKAKFEEEKKRFQDESIREWIKIFMTSNHPALKHLLNQALDELEESQSSNKKRIRK